MNEFHTDKDLPESQFAIVCDDTNQIDFIIAYISQKIIQNKIDKLVLIDFGNNSGWLNDISIKFRELWAEETYCPNEILIPNLKAQSISDAKLYIEGLSFNDVVIVFNLNNILPIIRQHGISMVKGGLSIQISPFSNLNWDEFREKILRIRSLNNSHLFFHLVVEKDCQDILKSTFNEDEIDILLFSK